MSPSLLPLPNSELIDCEHRHMDNLASNTFLTPHTGASILFVLKTQSLLPPPSTSTRMSLEIRGSAETANLHP